MSIDTAPAQGELFGYELRMNLADCDRAMIGDPGELLSWAQRLTEEIGMTAWGEPWIEHFGPTPEKTGWTLFFPLTESNITIHANDDPLTAFINVFSCMPFDPDKAIPLTKKMFDTEKCTHDFTERRAPV
jgi:S-adenosylmethionine/arginine decarboxylase-like enzyme